MKAIILDFLGVVGGSSSEVTYVVDKYALVVLYCHDFDFPLTCSRLLFLWTFRLDINDCIEERDIPSISHVTNVEAEAIPQESELDGSTSTSKAAVSKDSMGKRLMTAMPNLGLKQIFGIAKV